ncbi:type VI lipase adapter Tla3 domain-containing protein, partial [Aquabacterium sp.]|uniref:type VI lipase adapter Tla3 domain-containing protein n=1 Tax=Aquabacterium sp. TaxID=1872578 RepID=UPI003B71D078
MTQRTLGWLGLPTLAVALVASGMWMNASAQARQAQAPKAAPTQSEAPAPKVDPAEQARREYVLEVIGMGVTLDKYRQGKLWDALRQGHAFGSIRDQDPKKYPWSRDDKYGETGGRSASTLENGIGRLPMYWPAPSFYAGNAALAPESIGRPADSPITGLIGATDSNGLAWTLFISAGWATTEHPDRLLEKAFDFFDKHPDVPYLVVAAADSLYFRDLYRPKGTEPLIKDGHYIPSMPDSSALFVLARRERVEAIRPFAVEDVIEHTIEDIEELNRRGLARRIGVTYLGLMRAAQPRSKDAVHRNLTVPEWLAESA